MLVLNLWNTAETTQHNIELYDHAPVNLTYQFMSVQNINQTRGGYSQTFRVPATKNNTDFFGAIYDASLFTSSSGVVNGNYNVKRKIKATLSNDSLLLMSGYVQIKAVYIQKKDFADIELAFFADTNDFAKDVGDSLISDLTTTSIDHELTAAHVAQSWLGVLVSGNVTYGMMDKGQNWTFADTENPPWSIDDGLYQSDLTPFVKMKWLVDQIFSEAGYTYSSAFFDATDFGTMFLPAYNGELVPRSSSAEPEQQACLATMDTDVYGSVTTYTNVILTDTGGFDYGNNFNNASHRYTCPYSAVYVVKITMTRSDDQITYPAGIDIAVFKNGSQYKYFSGYHGSSFSETIEVDCVATDYLEMRWRTRGGTDGRLLGNGTASQTSMEIVKVLGPVTGQDIVMSANFPEMKQIELIQSLQKMFNLVFVPDKLKPKHLLIEPLKDYTETGDTKDWTNKVDYTKDIVLKPTTELQAKKYDWTYTKGGDFITSLIHAQTERVYGRYQVTDPENDFAVNSKTIQNGFSPYLMSYIPNSLFPIHRAIDVAGKALGKPLPRICYYHGLKYDVPPWYLKNDSLTTIAVDYLPSFSNYSSFEVEIADNDLNYGYEFPFIQVVAHPLHTLYYKYWMNYINELYSAAARTFTAYFYLTPVDIQQFEFSDKIFIKDTYFRIMNISNYDATTGGSVKVELLKILSDIKDCGLTPSSVDGQGYIRFSGGDVIDYGNQKCCERYGYRWMPRIGKCLPAQPQIPPDTYG